MSYANPTKVEVIEQDDHSNNHSVSVRKRRITEPILTKYEKARILGLRATQISKGAQPLVDVGDMKDALKIAEKEFNIGNIPLIIRRHMPDGSFEDWTLKELKNK